MLIAIGIGLHNFGEGLAIGGSPARGDISLATLLVVGFALHNATEGFGIVAPRGRVGTTELVVPPHHGDHCRRTDLIGTIVRRHFTSDAVSVVFLTLAAGSILYVIIQLLAMAQKMGGRELLVWGIFIGPPPGPHRHDRHRRGSLITADSRSHRVLMRPCVRSARCESQRRCRRLRPSAPGVRRSPSPSRSRSRRKAPWSPGRA